MFYNYVLQSVANSSLYIGYTSDLQKRFREHNNGFNPSTKKFLPWRLIYYEACINEKDAKRREVYLKSAQGRRLLKRRLKEYFYLSKD